MKRSDINHLNMNKRDCANHETAGDFRSEDGLSPKIHAWPDGKFYCNMRVHDAKNGFVYYENGKQLTYSPFDVD